MLSRDPIDTHFTTAYQDSFSVSPWVDPSDGERSVLITVCISDDSEDIGYRMEQIALTVADARQLAIALYLAVDNATDGGAS